jgi:hypothetical protein
MRFMRGRRTLPAFVLAAASVAAIGGAGAASASAATQCSGSNIAGQGAAVQKIAIQNVWGPGFNTSSDPLACAGTQGSGGKPTVTYTSDSSAVGLESWGTEKHAASFIPTNAYIGTEEAPGVGQTGEIEENETTKGSAKASLQTIPALQESIAVLVHLPAGCTASSTSNPGRLVLNNTTLQGIYLGTINTWGAIKDGGDTVTGTGCAADSITRTARLDSAGTTNIFKKYLALINGSPFETEAAEHLTWVQAASGSHNIDWPKAAIAVVKPAKTGDAAEVAKVAETPGTIGYAGMADARANTAFVPSGGGAGTAVFWAPVQRNGTAASGKYADPSTDGESATAANANCLKTKYTNGTGTKFPPKTTANSWAEVTTSTKEANYPICGFGYLLALSKYSAYPGTTEGEATTVKNFLGFVLSTGAQGGQSLLVNHDYEPLPTKVLKEAQKGAAAIVF